MDQDGAQGLKRLREVGWHTIAQDQKTCIVYGMPKVAVELGAAVEVLPVEAGASACMKFYTQLKIVVGLRLTQTSRRGRGEF